jgi:hypothetical protein
VLVVCTAGMGVATALVVRERQQATGAYAKEQLAHTEARAAYEKEQRQYRLARKLADEMILVANEEAPAHPGQQTLRRRVLETAVGYYREFIALRGGDPDARAELEATQREVQRFLSDLAVMQGGERHMMLSHREVQDELRLSAEQRARLAPVFSEMGGPGPNHNERPEDLLTEMKAHEAVIVSVLTTAQLTRLKQVTLQARGAEAFQDPDVVAALELSRDQRAALRRLAGGPGRGPGGPGPRRPWDDGPGDGPPGSPGSPPRGRRDGDPQGPMTEALAVLTPEQRKGWQGLIGEPFAAAAQLRPRGGPDRGGRRPGGDRPPAPPDEG